jgi:hypothetical protein
MLVTTALYCCTLATCKLRRHFVRPAFVRLRRKRTSWSLSASPAQFLLSFGHPSDPGRPKIPLGGETSDYHLVQGRACMDDAEKLPTCGVCVHTSVFFRHFSPAFFENRHHFRTSPLFTAHSPYNSTICPWISAGREFLAFKNPVTNRISQIVGFSFFVLMSSDCSEGGNFMTLHYAIHMSTLTYRRRMSLTAVRTSPARPLCVIGF